MAARPDTVYLTGALIPDEVSSGHSLTNTSFTVMQLYKQAPQPVQIKPVFS